MKTGFRMIGALALTVLFIGGVVTAGSVFDSRHNLSVSGKGEIRSTSETQVCIFCHSSHNASSEGPLWNHVTTQPGKFATYKRSTMNSQAQQPNGATKLCLSCHDGTIAVGAVRGLARPIPMRNVGSSGAIPTTRRSHIGTDLTGTHPVSVKYSQNVALADAHLRWPPFDPAREVGTDAGGFIQCTACHDPHDGTRSTKYPFWKKATFDEVCEVCHSY